MRRPTTGFTLVELMIVLVVLAILAMAVIPEYGSASSQARESSLATNLQTIARQIELYRLEHGGRLPHIDHRGHKDRNTARFIERLTSRTDKFGMILATGECGPYLMDWPANPFSKSDVAQKVIFGTDDNTPRDGRSGWYYNTETGEVSPNSQTGGQDILQGGG